MWFEEQGACTVSALVGPQHSFCHVDEHGCLPLEYLDKESKAKNRDKSAIAIKEKNEH